MKKRVVALLLLAAILLLVLGASIYAVKVRRPSADDPAGTPAGVELVTDEHTVYVFGSNGRFGPEDYVTRAEAANMLLLLLKERPLITVFYVDVSNTAWYAEAAGVMGTLGVMRDGMSAFQPAEEITRGEFVNAVASFFPQRSDAEPFADVPASHWAADRILTAKAYGWIDGAEDGAFYPDEPITRAQAVRILNRALGRAADRTYMKKETPVCFYADLPETHWAYYDVVEAAVPHTYELRDGEEIWTGHTASYGPFTSGSAELDEKLCDIVLEHTDDTMTQEQMLRALYVYTRDSFEYLPRPAYVFGATGWMQEDALAMLNTGCGNCYSYAALFWYLAQWIGYDAQVYSGTVGQDSSPHAWVEIEFDGKPYIFDAELEMAYHKKERYEIDLYKYIDVDDWDYRKP